jgi:hypothetical protein
LSSPPYGQVCDSSRIDRATFFDIPSSILFVALVDPPLSLLLIFLPARKLNDAGYILLLVYSFG